MGRKFSHFFHRLSLVLVSVSPSQKVFPSFLSFLQVGTGTPGHLVWEAKLLTLPCC